MKTIVLSESQCLRLFEMSPIDGSNSVPSEGAGQGEVVTTGRLEDEDGEKTFGKPVNDLGDMLARQDAWGSIGRGIKY